MIGKTNPMRTPSRQRKRERTSGNAAVVPTRTLITVTSPATFRVVVSASWIW